MLNRNYGKLTDGTITYAPSQIKIGDTYYPAPTDEQYLSQGWKALDLAAPSEPAPTGYHYEADGYSEDATTIRRVWKTVADPVIPRKFSKLKIYGAIISLPESNGTSAWAAVQAWLEAKTINGINGWMAFQLAQEISEDHPLFAPLAEEARVLLGLTPEQFETLLNACILED